MTSADIDEHVTNLKKTGEKWHGMSSGYSSQPEGVIQDRIAFETNCSNMVVAASHEFLRGRLDLVFGIDLASPASLDMCILTFSSHDERQ